MPTTAQHDQLIASLYAAASILTESVTDAVAIEEASLRDRALALNAVTLAVQRFSKAFAVAPASKKDDELVDIEFIFDEPEDPEEQDRILEERRLHVEQIEAEYAARARAEVRPYRPEPAPDHSSYSPDIRRDSAPSLAGV